MASRRKFRGIRSHKSKSALLGRFVHQLARHRDALMGELLLAVDGRRFWMVLDEFSFFFVGRHGKDMFAVRLFLR